MSKNITDMFILFVVSPVDSIKRGKQTENCLASEIYVQEIFLIHNWSGISAVLEILRVPLENRDKIPSGRPTALTSGLPRFPGPRVAKCHREGESCWAVPSATAAKPNLKASPTLTEIPGASPTLGLAVEKMCQRWDTWCVPSLCDLTAINWISLGHPSAERCTNPSDEFTFQKHTVVLFKREMQEFEIQF